MRRKWSISILALSAAMLLVAVNILSYWRGPSFTVWTSNRTFDASLINGIVCINDSRSARTTLPRWEIGCRKKMAMQSIGSTLIHFRYRLWDIDRLLTFPLWP